jgi:predicted MPP superfamily phosphohydrolase
LLDPVTRFRRLQVPANWPALSVLHLSDLHLRRSDPRGLARQARALARLPGTPDLACVTGDLCEREADAPLVADLLRQVRPRLGTFVILGNHEYGAGAPAAAARSLISRCLGAWYGPLLSSGPAEGDAIAATLQTLGVRVLRNAGVHLDTGSRSLWLGGVDSLWAGRADVPGAIHGRAADEGVLVMIHEPELVFHAIQGGADVVLAGHTHGGQVRLPVLGAPHWHRRDRRLTVPSGLQTFGAAQLHISAGTGQLVPLRLNCPSELVWLDCVPVALQPSGSVQETYASAHAAARD